MKIKAGILVDHRKAVIMVVTDQGEETRLTVAGVEKQLRRTGDTPLRGSYESQKVPASDRRDRIYKAHLNRYYDAVIAAVGDAPAVLIFGPGEAKKELAKRMKKADLGERIVCVESVDKLTPRQMAAEIRERGAAPVVHKRK